MTRALNLDGVAAPDFSGSPDLKGDVLTVTFAGTGDVGVVEILSAYLAALHAEALRLECSRVVCDFRALLFMNSSCFKAFVVWIDGVKNTERPYSIHFVTDPDLRWQRRSMEALRRLAPNIVTIDPLGAPSRPSS